MADPSTDLDAFRAHVRDWLAANLPQRGRQARGRGERRASAGIAELRRRQRLLCDAGLAGITWPVAYGGQGRGPEYERVFLQEAAGYDLPEFSSVAFHVTLSMIGPTLMDHASEAQKQRFLPAMLRGDELWAQFLSEPGAGSDLAGVLTRAEREGDGWRLNGVKIWTTGALQADYGLCLARTNWDVPKHRGLTWFVVPVSTPGVSIEPLQEITGAAEFCQEFLDDVVLPADAVVGAVDGGWPIANTLLAYERGAGRTPADGSASGQRRPLAPDLVALARRRGLTGDGATRQLIARAHIEDFMLGLLADAIGTALRSGRAGPHAASYVKLATGIRDPARAATAMAIAGSRAVVWDPGDEGAPATADDYLNGRVQSIAGGSNEIMRNVIGERVLGLPREEARDRDRPFREVQRDAGQWVRSDPG